MQWSKLKSRTKSLIVPELRDRIDFHLTSYRESHDGADKVWISVDGKRVFECKHYVSERWDYAAYFSGLRGNEIKSAKAAVGIHAPQDFGSAVRAYLDMPISEALNSSNPIVRAFAIVDRRVGKRTLTKLDVSDCDHALVKAFYDLRASAHV
jgi:hypothetical protein